ncbi:MAG: hypothetical protein H6582_12350 [Crocinitomicaceae bacterium]|nr:hypothetical protein [Crocinitomicaceae bacterium]
MQEQILEILFQDQKKGIKATPTFDILKKLNLINDNQIQNPDFFETFKSLLDNNLIEEVETKELQSMFFRITRKGIDQLIYGN